jgi:hypothetical protein
MPAPAFSLNPLRARSRAREISPLLCRAGQSRVLKASHTTGIPFRLVVNSLVLILTGYDYRHSRICTILDTDHFGCLHLYSFRQIFNCSSNALGIVETIVPSPDSHRICFPSLIKDSSDSVRTNSRYFCGSNFCKRWG